MDPYEEVYELYLEYGVEEVINAYISNPHAIDILINHIAELEDALDGI